MSTEGIIVNKSQRGMNVEYFLPLGIKEASFIMNETTKDNIMISKGMNEKGLHHKEDHWLPRIKVYFLAIVLLVITLDIKL